MAKTEQVHEDKSRRAGNHRQFQKKRHVRLERHKAKINPEIPPGYKQFTGYAL